MAKGWLTFILVLVILCKFRGALGFALQGAFPFATSTPPSTFVFVSSALLLLFGVVALRYAQKSGDFGKRRVTIVASFTALSSTVILCCGPHGVGFVSHAVLSRFIIDVRAGSLPINVMIASAGFVSSWVLLALLANNATLHRPKQPWFGWITIVCAWCLPHALAVESVAWAMGYCGSAGGTFQTARQSQLFWDTSYRVHSVASVLFAVSLFGVFRVVESFLTQHHAWQCQSCGYPREALARQCSECGMAHLAVRSSARS